MEKCKNIECDNSTIGNNLYCSLTCRNIYVNKYLRDYSKNSNGLSKEKIYYENPIKCVVCGEKLKYEQRRGKYCGHECSASETNKKREGIKYNLTKQGRISLIKSANENLQPYVKNRKYKKSLKQYKKTDVYCKQCNKELNYSRWKTGGIFCDMNCKNVFNRKSMTAFQKYKRDCLFKFNLSDYEKEFEFDLIKKHGWYKAVNHGNNLNGVSRDHMYSIKEGFDNKIEQKIIAHPANCKLVLQRENSSKYKKSSITIEELKKRIEDWNKKYIVL